ncbi:FAD-binding domain-containing protein [Rhodoferax sp.]|uniref:cryptochrome/deoxyribodipyrimidine photo-lyase family protein n=1 Tax=Rhodoferax sp. TaxID=50421 RepID=UPI0025E4FF1D|nr:FAD-binding domain-containing protein [Rhodoferax sp.]
MSYSVVWFKRDLRIHDHAALAQAVAAGPVLCVFCIEPALWRQADAATQHYRFMIESLRDLWTSLRSVGLQLQVVTEDAPDFLARLYAAAPFTALYSHQETGNDASFQRDRAVAQWCRRHQLAWHELPQFGVQRGRANRDAWSRHWHRQMGSPQAETADSYRAQSVALPWAEPPPPDAEALGLAQADKPARQLGGRVAGMQLLRSFIQSRSRQYRGGISSPLRAVDACSRLSPYLAWGCLSVREVWQSVELARNGPPPLEAKQMAGLAAFGSRLHWHCHFIQKLESEPSIEFANMHRGYDGLRESEHNPAHFAALVAGRTGWPLVDACVAMLRQTGWLNFRMRAMLVSVAAYPLWLHWRPVGEWLATEFLDYEPGIHWSQMQMQSGTTGINTARIYNPIKQAQDQDPEGQFVRHWLPAMRKVPDAWLFEPWRMPADMQARCGLRVGGEDADLPVPLVDLEQATRLAKARLFQLRARPDVKAAKAAIVQQHGSRNLVRKRSRAAPGMAAPAQLELL